MNLDRHGWACVFVALASLAAAVQAQALGDDGPEKDSGTTPLAQYGYGLFRSMDLSADGTRLVTGGGDGKARLWDVDTGQVLRTFEGHAGWMNCAVFSHDGSRILTGGADETARLWDVATGTMIQAFSGHTGGVTSAAFSPNGTHVITRAYNYVSRLWDVSSGAEIFSFTGSSYDVQYPFSPDGSMVVTGYGGDTKVWSVTTGTLIRTVPGKIEFVRNPFSSDGSKLLTVSGTTAKLWDVLTGVELRSFSEGTDSIKVAALSDDGGKVITGTYGKAVNVWKVSDGSQLCSLGGHSSAIYDAAFSADGTTVLTPKDGVTLWNTLTGEAIRNFPLATLDWPGRLTWTPDGSAFLAGQYPIQMWRASDGSLVHEYEGHVDYSARAVYSPDGEKVLLFSEGSSSPPLMLFDADTGDFIRKFSNPDASVVSAVFSPDGARIAVASSPARVWDVETGAEVFTLPVDEGWTWSVAFSPDGSTIATGGYLLRLWNAATGEITAEVYVCDYTGDIRALDYAPDGRSIAFGTDRVYVTSPDGASCKPIYGPIDMLRALDFSPDGKKLLTASGYEGFSCYLNDALTGGVFYSFPLSETANDAEFSPNGQQALIAEDDGLASLWDVETGQRLCTYEGQPRSKSATFSADGLKVLIASNYGYATVWPSGNVVVPGVLGSSLGIATTMLTDAGLTLGSVQEEYSTTVPEGVVIAQSVSAGNVAFGGSAVNLVVSKGRVPVVVPDVVGLAQAVAGAVLGNAGLSIGDVLEEHSATVAAGRVISQDPAASAVIVSGSPVNLVVSKGQAPVYTVPDVAGLTQADAGASIGAAGLVVGTVSEDYSAVVPLGLVISQDPADGTIVAQGSAVNLVVSKGPEPVYAVPDVVGMKHAVAGAVIALAGLSVGSVNEVYDDIVAAGLVISQNPAAGSSVSQGFPVNLTVSKGKLPESIPPTGSITINGDAACTGSSEVVLDLRWDDGAGSGVSRMRFSNDGATWTPWEVPVPSNIWTLLPGEGYRTVRVQYRDRVGNVSLRYTDYIKVDTTPPTGEILINKGAWQTFSSNVTLSLTWNDGQGSGVSRMRFSNNGSTWSAWEPSASSKSWVLGSNMPGYHTVRVQFIDRAGNTSERYSDYIHLSQAP